MVDPNEVPQEPQDEQVEQDQQPEVPSIDPAAALEIAAQQYGVSPDYLEGAVRLQEENRRVAEENRRRMRELERREAQLEALARERQQYAPPRQTYDDMDPVTRRMFERLDQIDRRFEERDNRERQMVEHQQRVQRVAQELDSEYLQIMRTVPSQSRVDRDRFFETMGEIYPTENGELPPGITPQKAAYNTAKFLGLVQGNGGGGYRPPMPQARDRRATFVVPSQGGAAQSSPDVNAGPDLGPQREGETTEQYHNRLKRGFEQSGYTHSGLVPKGGLSSG